MNRGKRFSIYKIVSEKETYFYKESVLFPFVNIIEDNKGLILKDEDFTDILIYVEQNGYIHV